MIEDFVIEDEDPQNIAKLEKTGWYEKGGVGFYNHSDFPDLWIDVNCGYMEVYAYSKPPRRGECPGEYDDTLFWGNFNAFKVWLKEYKR